MELAKDCCPFRVVFESDCETIIKLVSNFC